MTDNEIIKYLEQAIDKYNKNEIFVDNMRLDELSLDLINRQKAEIERLQKDLNIWKDIAHRETGYVEIAKYEAYKELGEKVYKHIRAKAFNLSLLRTLNATFSAKELYEVAEEVNDIVKEKVGDTE